MYFSVWFLLLLSQTTNSSHENQNINVKTKYLDLSFPRSSLDGHLHNHGFFSSVVISFLWLVCISYVQSKKLYYNMALTYKKLEKWYQKIKKKKKVQISEDHIYAC